MSPSTFDEPAATETEHPEEYTLMLRQGAFVSHLNPRVRVEEDTAILEGTEEQFRGLYEALNEMFEFGPEEA